MADTPLPPAAIQQLDNQPIITVNGDTTSSNQPKLTPAQQRQLEADSQSVNPPTPSSPTTSRHRRKQSTPPNLLSEGDFPSLSSGTKPPIPSSSGSKPISSSWGAKRPITSPSVPTAPIPPTPTTINSSTAAFPSLNGVNGRTTSSTTNSSRASTPAPTTTTTRTPAVPGIKNLQSNTVTEQVRFRKDQLATPNAKEFTSVCEKVTRFAGVDKISVSRMKVSEVVTFSITGKPENVVKARNRLQNEVGVKRTEKVFCPASVLPYIIGKKGVSLKNIQEMSGANVKVPKREDNESSSIAASEDVEEDLVEISIEGIDAAITKAKTEINKIIDEKTSKKTEKLTDIPSDYYLLLAGPNDSNITEWEGGEDKDIKIRIPNPHHPSSSSDEFITLTGHRDLVAQVREKIESLYKKLKSSTAAVTVEVPRAQHRFLIGDRGEGIKTLLAETGCAVIVPPLRVDAGDSIVIRSERAKVGAGLGRVLERAAEVTLVTVDLNALTGKDDKGIAHARNLYRYARRQNLFSKLAVDGVNLTIPKPSTVMTLAEERPSIIFEIDGKDADAVNKVEAALKSLITFLSPEKFETIEIDPCLHGILIGKKGAGLQSIKDQFNVFCLFEKEEDSDPEILLVYEGNDSPKPSLTGAKDHMKHLASTIPDIEEQTLPIPRKYHKIIVGPNGTTLNALIGDQTDRATRVNVYVGGKSRDPEKQEDVVIVRGPSKDMQRVVKNINEHVAEAKHTEFITSHVEEFTIPVDYSKNIIGKGGKRIQELRDRFGVQIKVDEGKVHIQGVKKNAEEAKKSIQTIVNELKDDTIERIPVKNEHHGHLIGEKGANVRRLQERYGVRIHFPRREDEEERNSLPDEEKPRNADEIVVRGPSKGVKAAVDELKALLDYRVQRSHTAEIEILARGRQRLLRNGGIVHSLRQDPGHVRIDVPSRSDDEAEHSIIKIRVEGTADFVKKASKEISSLRDEVKGETIRTLTVEQKHHKGLIGPGGRIVQKTIIDAGGPEDRSAQARIVRFPRPGDESDKIVLTGPPAVVDAIAEKFLEFAARETIEIDVPTDKLSWIIGSGGKKRMELEAEYDVTIYVPQINRGAPKEMDKVKVTGKPEQNEKAKKAILDIVKSGDGVTVQVPRRLHHRVLNDGRTKNQLRQRFSVYVNHEGAEIPPVSKAPANGNLGRIDDEEEESFSWHVAEEPEDSSDETIPWKLRGSNDANLQKAKGCIENLINSIQDQGNCTGYLGVPPEHHHLVIGKGGQRIASIREETGCAVDVPKRGDGNDTIVIRGSRDGVERAKDMIVQAVEEGQHRSNGGSPQRRRY